MNHKLYHLLHIECALCRVTTLSYEDWLYRKADQYAHNEILAFLMMILGMVSLIGGLNITVVVSGQLLIPIFDQYPLNSSSSVGLILTSAGFVMLLIGFVSTVHYDRKRSWHVGQIEKAYRLKNRKVDAHVIRETLEIDKEARARIKKIQSPKNADLIVSPKAFIASTKDFIASSQETPKKKAQNDH